MKLWLMNHMGSTLTSEQMESIESPTAELTTHVTIKVIQANGLLGTCLVGPLWALARAETRNLAGLTQKAVKCGKYGMALGLIMGPLMTYGKVKSLNVDEITDRDFRLRYNRNQVRVDRGSFVGALGGGIVTSLMGQGPMLGVLVGMSTGIIGMAIYNNKILPKE